MHKKIAYLSLFCLFIACSAFMDGKDNTSFKEDQFRYPRVRQAFEMYEGYVETKLLLKDIRKSNVQIYIRAFKMENTLELWAKNKRDGSYQLISDYKFCESSGRLGPKREQGDRQIPEGIYHISAFNPSSNYHLSLKINYPNASDSILGVEGNYGGMIFIHGGCASIGCIPITDDWISELYVISVMAKEAGQDKIPVHIFPARLNQPNLTSLKKQDYPLTHLALWNDLAKGYRHFENTGQVPEFKVNNWGKYIYQKK